MVGTPAGGSLYARFGFRAPFVFGEICAFVDLILRLLIIERDVAIKWGYDPATGKEVNVVTDLEALPSGHPTTVPTGSSQLELLPVQPSVAQTSDSFNPKQNPGTLDSRTPATNNLTTSDILPVRKPLPVLTVGRLLGQSPRAVVALTMSLIYGYVALAR